VREERPAGSGKLKISAIFISPPPKMPVFLLTWVRGDIICIPRGTQGHISLFPAPERI